jgi:phenylpropionate dioxygenase-like ring-hydroxylating dioxygenase large terminal subunit
MGREVIVWRDSDGRIAVHDAYCPHMGAHLGHGGKVEDGCLRCPFHHFKYDAAGRPAGHRGRALHTYPTRELAGMIYAWFHAEDDAPTWELPDFSVAHGKRQVILSHSPMRHFNNTVIDYIENSLDPRHFTIIHRFAEADVTDAQVSGPHLCHRISGRVIAGGPNVTIDFHWFGPCFGYADTEATFAGFTYRQRHVHNSVIRDGSENTLYNVKLIDEDDRLAWNHLPRSWLNWLASLVAGVTTWMIDRQDHIIWEHRVHLEKPCLTRDERGVAVLHDWLPRFYP